MKSRIRTAVRIGTAIIALALAGASSVQSASTVLTPEQLAERRAAARQQAEESIRYLNELLAKAQAEAEARRALLQSRPPLDPQAAKAAAEKRRYALRRQLAPWLFDGDGKPNPAGLALCENKAGRERALAAAKSPCIRLRVNPQRLLRPLTGTQSQAVMSEPQTNSDVDRLYLVSWDYDENQGATFFQLWLVNAPLNEWWEIYWAPELRSTAWRLAYVGPPDWVSQNVQVFTVAVLGQPSQAYFQIFLNKDSDYDGVPDGYEICILKTDPENPDSNANGIADGDEDADGDGLSNEYEAVLGTDPTLAQSPADSDRDGLPDWLESYVTSWTGITNPSPWGDADGDGLANLDEFDAGLDPTLPDYLLFNPPLADHQRFVEDSVDPRLIVDASYPLAATGWGGQPVPAVHKYFPGEITIGGVLNMVGSVVVLVDQDAGGNPAPGRASVRWSICSLAPFINMIPSFPAPDSLDGLLWRSLLVHGTDLANDIWAEVNEDVLRALRQRTLEYIQGVSALRIAVEFRKIQYLQTGSALPDGSVLRIRRSISIIHTEATRLTAVTMRYGEAYPTLFQSRFLRYGASGVILLAKGLSWWENLDTLRRRFAAYCHNVSNMCDGGEPALLSIALQNLVADFPGWPLAIRNAMGIFRTTPLFDPNPLGLYEGGGNDCN
jgi:hypothetical protein